MHILRSAGGRKRRFDCIAQVNANNIARSPLRREQSVPSLTAATFQHHFVFKKILAHRSEPAEHLLLVSWVDLSKVLPLPAKAGGRGRFIFLNLREVREPRHPANDGKRLHAIRTLKSSFKDLVAVLFCDLAQVNHTLTGRAREILQQSFFHTFYVSLRLPTHCSL